ncbi:hypothetical protein F2Q70_00028023 [Brassica cretica]|uniref:Uncharacterized protein n=1 Tax=Brassica cretica TaxID=69181 RepID=A0A8S9JD08_BRACR|nr:hypothetical protein F2Q68_00001185 [Brassica cretica]KAF2601870.1 hypothetical protein F2Q70_00028023 [Brassica cretica]
MWSHLLIRRFSSVSISPQRFQVVEEETEILLLLSLLSEKFILSLKVDSLAGDESVEKTEEEKEEEDKEKEKEEESGESIDLN